MPALASPAAAAAAEPSANRRRRARTSESHSERERAQLARQLELMLATAPPSTLLALLRGVLPSSSSGSEPSADERAGGREREREEEEEESMTKTEIQRRMAAELLRRLLRSSTSTPSTCSTPSTHTKQAADEHAAPLALPLVLRLVDDSARAVRESIPATTSTSTAGGGLGGGGRGAVRPEYTWSRARAPLRAFAQLAGDALPLFTPGGAARLLRSLVADGCGDGAGAAKLQDQQQQPQQQHDEGEEARAEAMLAFVCKVTREVVEIERRLPPVPASFLAFAEPRSNGTSSAQLIDSGEESKGKAAEGLAQMCIQHAHAAALCPAPSTSTPTPDAVLASLLAPLLQSWEALLRAAAAQQEKHAERERWGIARARSASRQADEHEQEQEGGRKGQWLAALAGLAQEIDAALLSQGRGRADGPEQPQGHTGTAADPARTVLLALQRAMQLLGEAVQRW